ncbi:MAG TPA: alpha/beta fold hydrolase [Vicinamibacterales bacterium]|nr:alpha/beta fold hydrolase [Vicinamibacterales bacterium]
MIQFTSAPSLSRLAVALLLLATAALPAPAQTAAAEGNTQFLVFLGGRPVGREEVVVLKVQEGWIVRGSSRLGQPIDITSRVAEVQYDSEWRPTSLHIDGVVRGQDVSLKTTFAGGRASNVIAIQGKTQSKEDPVAVDTIVLPNSFLGSYAALAKRLQGRTAGAELRGYIAPQAEVPIRVLAVTQERIETPRAAIAVSRYSLVVSNPPPAGEMPMNLWADQNGDLIRMQIPAQQLELAREDIASAASRTTAFSLPGDESVTIPALGFNLGGTITRPKTAGLAPALILIGGSGPTDRDETVAGIPIFGQIARELVNAGFAVVRYDKRGVGQSGGRGESATIADYAEDARWVLNWLEDQKGIDKERIGLVGHSEGALAAMLLAARERGKVKAIALLAAPSTNGSTVVLEQQKHILSKMPIEDAERAEKVALQEKINNAVIKGTGWNDIPEAARRVADTPWFYSFLTFDPRRAMNDTRQPVLIVQGELDTQVMPYHADRLAEFARARRAKAAVEVAKVPGVNHLLVPAKTGDVSEYATLGENASVSSQVTAAIAAFMTKALPTSR